MSARYELVAGLGGAEIATDLASKKVVRLVRPRNGRSAIILAIQIDAVTPSFLQEAASVGFKMADETATFYFMTTQKYKSVLGIFS